MSPDRAACSKNSADSSFTCVSYPAILLTRLELSFEFFVLARELLFCLRFRMQRHPLLLLGDGAPPRGKKFRVTPCGSGMLMLRHHARRENLPQTSSDSLAR